MANLMRKQTFYTLVGGVPEAQDFEERVLNSGREFLPKCAQDVLDGEEPTNEYWDFLTTQWRLSQ
jgi:hypothetical protein